MTRPRPSRRAARPLLWAGALLLGSALLPAPAAAIQVFIDNIFIHQKNPACTQTNFTSGAIHFVCPGTSVNPENSGNISNDPRIEFERQVDADACAGASGSLPLTSGQHHRNVCNSDLFLCAAVGYNNETSSAVAIDEVNFELFKFQDGSNPLDPASTPPLRTFYIDAPGLMSGGGNGVLGPYCVLWNGEINLQGEFGKSNGQYGFRATVKTNQSGASGNINITQTRAYPGGSTHDAPNTYPTGTCPSPGCVVAQRPITVDVTNVHVVRSSPSVVGNITGVAAQPYNLTYRLSKDATMYVNIFDSSNLNTPVRNLVAALPRVGEGVPQGSLLNGDSWNGRANNGDLLPAGLFLVSLQAVSDDQWTPGSVKDLSEATTRQVSIEPLQITDLRVQPLLAGSTSLAVLSYELTEPATVFIDIYPENTQFCAGLNGVTGLADGTGNNPPKDFQPHMDSCSGGAGSNIAPLRRIVEQKTSRVPVVSFWDGRDASGAVMDDGNYVFVLYAALGSQNGTPFNGQTTDRRIWTSTAKSGFLPIIRGFVGISQINPGSSVVGSSPGVAGLNPFLFRYTLSREAIVAMRIFDQTGTRLVKTLVSNVVRPGLFPNQERWDEPVDDAGRVVSSGTYMVQLTAADPLLPAKVSTTTVLFPVDLFRIVDVNTTPLLSGASDQVTLTYQLSQPMNIAWNIYPPGTQILNSSGTWPPCASLTPGSCSQVVNQAGANAVPLITFRGLRPGRLRITEFWDGRDQNGLFVPDGSYVFTLAAQSTTTPQYFASDRVFGSVTVARGNIIFTSFNVEPSIPTLFHSSSTITLHPFNITYGLTRQSSVTIQVLTTNVPPAVVRNLVSGQLRQSGILLTDVWDGRDDRGNFPPTGFYTVRALANDLASQLSSGSTAQLTIPFEPLRIYDIAVTPFGSEGSAEIFFQVSEPMKFAIKIFRPGTIFDQAGNPSPPESRSLVKRIVGFRQDRESISASWDGTDRRLTFAPDGPYKFKIVASTDVAAIDSITGDVLNPGALSLDRPIGEISLVRGLSADPKADFENNSFAYPNPVTGPSATFSIFSPFEGNVKLRVYTMSGEMILDKDLGRVAAGECAVDPTCVSGYVWNKTNQAGRKVARGLYMAVIRVEETLGGKNVLQTVKKILIP